MFKFFVHFYYSMYKHPHGSAYCIFCLLSLILWKIKLKTKYIVFHSKTIAVEHIVAQVETFPAMFIIKCDHGLKS